LSGTRWRGRPVYFAVAAAVLILDQATKIIVHATLRGRDSLVLIPGWLNLGYSRNAGGLFGYFRDMPDPWRTLLLTLLPAVAIALIAGFLTRSSVADRPTLAGLALILGGATGNLVDRLARHEVIDFIDVYVSGGRLAETLLRRFGTAHWPTFNLADSAIVVGAGLLMLSVLRPGAPRAAAARIERPS
jgi:signal peptidase II